jgi:protein-L-isoaspartate(D-aspartate) O-methyltransferase
MVHLPRLEWVKRVNERITAPDAGRDALLRRLRRLVREPRVLEALRRVPRERFVPPELRDCAWENRPLPIGAGQTISQPEIVAAMTEALALSGDERVLEIGTGSGYQTAVLSYLAGEVISVERLPSLAERAREVLADLGCTNVRIEPAGAELGRPEDGPYDAIIVTAGAPAVPGSLLRQLRPGGRMVIPVGSRREQDLLLIAYDSHGGLVREYLGPCRFVPLVGAGAWPNDTI